MSNSSPKTTGIAKKLIYTLLPLMSAAIFILLIMSYISTKKALIASASETLRKETAANVNSIETFVESTLSSLNRVYDTMKTVSFDSEDAKIQYLSTTLEIQPEIPLGVYVGDNTNYWLDPSGWVPEEGYEVAEQSWYQEGLTHDSFTFGAPYIDANTGGYIVSATALLSSEPDKKAVIAADVSLKALSEYITSIDVMENGYLFLADTRTDTVLAHKNTMLIDSPLSTNSNDGVLRAAASLADCTEYTEKTISSDGQVYMIAAEPIEHTDWILVSCIDRATVLAPLTRWQVVFITLSIILILLISIIVSQVVRIIIAPVKTLTETISAITDGDFSVDIEVKGNDEISVMSSALKDFVEIMKEVIEDIRTVSEELNEQAQFSKEVAASLSEAACAQTDSNGEMMMTIEQLTAYLPEEHAEISEEIRASMNTFADTSLQLSQESTDVSGCADIIAESAFTLAEHMRKFKTED